MRRIALTLIALTMAAASIAQPPRPSPTPATPRPTTTPAPTRTSAPPPAPPRTGDPVASAAQAQRTESRPSVSVPTAPNKVPKIGFVDVELIIDQSQAVRRVLEQVDADLEKEGRKLRSAQREYRTLALRMEEQGSVMSEQERGRVREQMGRMLDEMDEMQFRLDREMRDRQRRVIDPVLDVILRRIADLGARGGYDMIVRGEVVLYGRDTIDLTAEVLKDLDANADQLTAAVSAAASSRLANDDDQTTPTAPRRRSDPLVPLLP